MYDIEVYADQQEAHEKYQREYNFAFEMGRITANLDRFDVEADALEAKYRSIGKGFKAVSKRMQKTLEKLPF